MRFSDNNRPILPGSLDLGTTYPLFVADDSLGACKDPQDDCLYKNMTCLLITREVLGRLFKPSRLGPQGEQWFDLLMIAGYAAVLAACVLFTPVRSLDALFWTARWWRPIPYHFLVTVLFFSLLFIALSAWLRLILVWSGLRRGLLQRLESLPIRYAFNCLSGRGWMAMLRQDGMHEQWRDMSRSIESMRQMVNDSNLAQLWRMRPHRRLPERARLGSQGAVLGGARPLAARLAGDSWDQRRATHLPPRNPRIYFRKSTTG